MVAVNSTVVHRKNALNANFVEEIKLTSSVSLQHCAQYRLQYSVCVTSVPYKQEINACQIIIHWLEEGTETVCNTVHKYIYTYMYQLCSGWCNILCYMKRQWWSQCIDAVCTYGQWAMYCMVKRMYVNHMVQSSWFVLWLVQGISGNKFIYNAFFLIFNDYTNFMLVSKISVIWRKHSCIYKCVYGNSILIFHTNLYLNFWT
jgi:hypothetical protein